MLMKRVAIIRKAKTDVKKEDVPVLLIDSLTGINNVILKLLQNQKEKKFINQWKVVKKSTSLEYEITLPTKETFVITINFTGNINKRDIRIIDSSRHAEVFIKRCIAEPRLKVLIDSTIKPRYRGFKAEHELFCILKNKIAFKKPFVGIERSENDDDKNNHVDFYLLIEVGGKIQKIPIDSKNTARAQKQSILRNGHQYPTMNLEGVKELLRKEHGEKTFLWRMKIFAFDYLSGKPVKKKRIHFF